VSGPARAGRGARPGGRDASKLFGRLLDRLVWNPPARAWIGVVAFALIGIVAMQLWVVKLGVGIGHALEHAQLLQRENSTLEIEDSSLSSGERIERLALARGMVLAPPGALHFDALRGPLDARLAAAALAKPAQAPSSTTAGTGAATSTEASAGATSGTEASPGATAGTEASGATAGTETISGATTSADAGGEAASPQTPTTQTPSGQTSPTGTPAAEMQTAGSPAAPASAPTGTGGTTEATSPQTGSGGGSGGTQIPPGG
jgi:cell division protein FtsL